MAVAAFQAVVGLEPRPFVLRQREPVVQELPAGVDGAEDVPPHLLGCLHLAGDLVGPVVRHVAVRAGGAHARTRSEEHTSELQSLMRISYAVFCLKKKKKRRQTSHTNEQNNKSTNKRTYIIDNRQVVAPKTI